MTRSHTSTAQWQSFEVRMRRRRLERCILRAEVALEAGYPDDARLAMDEARQLDPYEPLLAELASRISAASTPVANREPQSANRRLLPLAAALLLAVALSILAIPDRRNTPAVDTAGSAPEPGRAVPRATVGIQEQLVTPEIVFAREPEPRAESEVTRRAAPPAPRQEPEAPAEKPRAEPPAPQRVAAATPPPPDFDVPTLATSTGPAPITPLASLGSAIPATLPAPEPAMAEKPAVDPAAESVSRIRAVLSRYEAAYSGLDAAAARDVWPSVDERLLARAFNNLESQRISLDRCDVSVDGASARAECQGSASWVPKVGGGGQSAARRWTFDLRQAGGGWQIVRAEAR